jgi:peroxiredoxin
LADFQEHLNDFEKIDTKIVAASSDTLDIAATTERNDSLTYPIACKLDPREVSRLIGANDASEKNFLHATSFILNRDGKVMLAVYSSGAIGRLTAKDCLGLIKHLQKQEDQN